MADTQHPTPVPLPSATVYPAIAVSGPAGDEESGRRKLQPLRRRRRMLWCCGCCGAATVLIGVVILVLALTVFRIRDPELTMNHLHLDHLFVPGLGSLQNPTVSVNATLTADVSIKNPNVASFRFGNATTEFFYIGELVGVAYSPDGHVKPWRTARMNVTVDVLADRVVLDTNATSTFVFAGEVNMSSYTDIAGRVNVLGVYKRNLEVELNCTFTVDLFGRTLSNTFCQSHVK
ncbi:hypothetical protein AXF42_Ash005707 [Apostasia shenzhenica]|uniref:Late embryogenesis abundant protein LEA-2 subgroup domain-containing protein n=1 Tax=Apostasia shenzhenica TaxID=1088818 RepID=A0A2I0BC47_9ASPA|nr:hypothetical protein AXF42_Ash005707 [Apostasia shenzhenica]